MAPLLMFFVGGGVVDPGSRQSGRPYLMPIASFSIIFTAFRKN